MNTRIETAQDFSELIGEGGVAGQSDMFLLDDVKREIDSDKELTKAGVARAIGASATTLNEVLSGKYKGDPEPTREKLRNWLRDRQERRVLAPTLPSPPPFVETPTAKRVWNTLRLSQLMSQMAILYGGAGMGKSLTAREYQRGHNRVYIATFAPHHGSQTAALQAIAKAVGINVAPHERTGSRMFERILMELTNECLLVIDEAQHAKVAAIESVRSIHDATGCGVVLMGNEPLYDLIYGRRGRDLAQLFSRISLRCKLELPSKEDVSALCGAWGLPKGRPVSFLESVAARPGALRTVGKVIQLAVMNSRKPAAQLDEEALKMALAQLGLER